MKTIRLIFLLGICLVFLAPCFSQSVSINEDGSNPDPSAMLDIKSNNKGILIPRLSTSERMGISPAATGLLVFDTDINNFFMYDGEVWKQISTLSMSYWSRNDETQSLYPASLPDHVSIGTNYHTHNFHVEGISSTSSHMFVGGNLTIEDNTINNREEWEERLMVYGRIGLYPSTVPSSEYLDDKLYNANDSLFWEDQNLLTKGTLYQSYLEGSPSNHGNDIELDYSQGPIRFYAPEPAKTFYNEILFLDNSLCAVGIGTVNPSEGYKLDINGKTKFRNTASFDEQIALNGAEVLAERAINNSKSADALQTYGLYNTLIATENSSGESSRRVYGVYNKINAEGETGKGYPGVAYGLYNHLITKNSDGAEAYGVYITSDTEESDAGKQYGLYVDLPLPSAKGPSVTEAIHIENGKSIFHDKVGIGLSNPQQELHIHGNIKIDSCLYDATNSQGNNNQVLTSNGNGVIWTDQSNIYDNDWAYFSGSGLDGKIYHSGNVGIGLSNPVYRLSVNGDMWVGTNLNIGRNLAINYQSEDNVNISTLTEAKGSPGTEQFNIKSRVYARESLLSGNSNYAYGSYNIIDASTENGSYQGGKAFGSYNILTTYTGGSPATSQGIIACAFYAGTNNKSNAGTQYGLYVNFTGESHTMSFNKYPIYIEAGSGVGPSYFGSNVGIGTTNPTKEMHIKGGLRLEGGLFDSSNSDGNSGQLLSSNGNATSWINQTAINDGDWMVEGNNVFTNNSLVGIGTSTPISPLSIISDSINLITLKNPNTNGECLVRIDNNAGFGLQLGATGTAYDGHLPYWQNKAGIIAATSGLIIEECDEYPIEFYIDSVKRMEISSEGNLGIGIENAKNKIDIAGAGVIGSAYAANFTAPLNGLLVQGNTGIGLSQPLASLHIKSPEWITGIFENEDPNSQSALDFYTDRGRALEIGACGSSFSDSGEEWANKGGIVVTDTMDGFMLAQMGDHPIQFLTNDQQRMEINGNGMIGIGLTNAVNKMDIKGNMAIGNAYAGSITAPDNSLIIEGKLGIGCTDPEAKLDVSGVVKLNTQTAGPAFNTSKLYNLNGDLYWEGLNLTNGGSLPSGSDKQTLRHNGSNWVTSSNLSNNGTNIGIGTISPVHKLEIKNGNTLFWKDASTTITADIQSKTGTFIYAQKGALRSGRTDDHQDWYDANIGFYSTALGHNSRASATCSFAHGDSAYAQSEYAVAIGLQTYANAIGAVAIGKQCHASAEYATVSGGWSNHAEAQKATIAGGINNKAYGDYSVISGGAANITYDRQNFIGCGWFNTCRGEVSTISGGQLNQITNSNCDYATIGGGKQNTINADTCAVICGGSYNHISGSGSVIPGGYANNVNSDFSLAFGYQASTEGQDSSAVFFWENPGKGCVYIAKKGTPTSHQLYIHGNAFATGAFIDGSSDIRLKKDISDIDNALIKIENLRPVSFKWKNNNATDIGFIAQEVKEVIPEIITEGIKPGYLAIKYNRIIAINTAAIKDLHRENNSLKKENTDLRIELDVLKKRIEEIENVINNKK